MKKWKLYQYDKCSTCKKAIQYLEKKGVPYEKIDLKTEAPNIAELKRMLGLVSGNLKKLFNVSGIQYRELKLGEKLQTMTEEKALQLLAQNGMLVKRPFLLKEDIGAVGFKEEEWKKLF